MIPAEPCPFCANTYQRGGHVWCECGHMGKAPEPDLAHIEQQARFESVRVAQRIALEANKHTHPPAFAGTCASIALQTVLVSLLLDHYEPASADGEAELRKFYENALKDAVERWHKPDLKERRWQKP